MSDTDQVVTAPAVAVPHNPMVLAEPGPELIAEAVALAKAYQEECTATERTCQMGKLVESYAPAVAQRMYKRLKEQLPELAVRPLSDKVAIETGSSYLIVADRSRKLSMEARVEVAVRAIALAAAGYAVQQSPLWP